MTTVETLKLIYQALGGSAEDVADLVLIPEILSKIALIIPIAISGNDPDEPST